MIEFAGGLNLDTSGPIRVEEREKQWYVIGEGLLLPADSEEDAQGVLNSIVTQGIYMDSEAELDSLASKTADARTASQGAQAAYDGYIESLNLN